jgi:hypothetical protein
VKARQSGTDSGATQVLLASRIGRSGGQDKQEDSFSLTRQVKLVCWKQELLMSMKSLSHWKQVEESE